MNALQPAAMLILRTGLAVFFLALAARPCTIAVIGSRASADGRPLIWKNRDVDEQDNLLKYFAGTPFDVIALVQAGQTESVWGGLNSAGLAVVNSVSDDLEGSSSTDNGRFMKRALETCSSVDEFEALLQATNSAGRKTQANYAVIDAAGSAAMFETGNTSYARFDAEDEPLGFVVRTNFALSAARPEEGGGFVRFERASRILSEAATDGLGVRLILERAARDLVNDTIDPYPLPYEGSQEGHPPGYVRTNYSINRYLTASCLLVHGVLPGESPLLSTLWCLLGEPVCGVALPVWIRAAAAPAELTGTAGAPLRNLVGFLEQECYTDSTSSQYLDTRRLATGDGRGILLLAGALEEAVLEAAARALDSWRVSLPAPDTVASFQARLSSWAYRTLGRWSWF